MENPIEKLNKKRKLFLWIVFSGTLISFAILIYETFAGFLIDPFKIGTGLGAFPYFFVAVCFWLATIIIFFVQFLVYKAKLKKDASVQMAVYDERIKMNWLKAFRIAFFVLVGMTATLLCLEWAFPADLIQGRLHLPNRPFTVLWAAIVSLSGSFLYFNREGEHE